jgi:hypothetical protein
MKKLFPRSCQNSSLLQKLKILWQLDLHMPLHVLKYTDWIYILND